MGDILDFLIVGAVLCLRFCFLHQFLRLRLELAGVGFMVSFNSLDSAMHRFMYILHIYS